MDVSKYHTKYPPPEHEEAVRMLLEGLEKQTTQQSDLKSKSARSPQIATKNSKTSNNRDRGEKVKPARQREESHMMTQSKFNKAPGKYPLLASTNDDHHQASPAASSVDSGSVARGPSEEEEYEEDEAYEFSNENQPTRGRATTNIENDDDQDNLEFNSEESSSREFSIQVSPQISSKRGHVVASLPKMQSKATSTASDTISTSGASSSGHLRAANELASEQDDTNGNYEAIPSRTIAIQCDLKLSSVKRDGYLDSASTDLASMQASSISSTRYGFYKLSPETLEQRRQLARSVSSRNIAHGSIAPPQNLNVAEAPTSMSELSSEDEVEEVGGFDRELAAVVRRKTSLGQRSVDEDLDSVHKFKRDDRFLSQRQLHQTDRTSASRARRQDSLPRRPKTALSYVSTSRLRDEREESAGEQTPDKSLSDHEQEGPIKCSVPMSRRMTPRSRAMSQQVLSSLNRAGQPRQRISTLRNRASADERLQVSQNQENVSLSNSDSELDKLASTEQFRLPQQEEMVVAAKRGRPAMGASPRVRRSNNIRNGPLLRRYATLTTPNTLHATPIKTGDYNKENNNVHESHLSDREMHATSAVRRQRNSMATNKIMAISSGTNYSTTDEENQLTRASAETRRQRAATHAADQHHHQQEQPKARFSSMSLSRRQQPLLMGNAEQTRAHSNLINPTRARPAAAAAAATKTNTVTAHSTDAPTFETTEYSPAGQEHQRSMLARADRPSNHRAEPMNDNNRAPIGRSASMKQGRTRLLAAGEYDQAQPVYTIPTNGTAVASGKTSHRQRNYYDPGTHCEYDDCCGPPIAGDLEGQEGYVLDERDLQGPDPAAQTWANPSSTRRRQASQSHHQSVYNLSNNEPVHHESPRRPSYPQHATPSGRPLNRKSARSHSMRNVNQIDGSTDQQLIPGMQGRPRRFESIYHAGQEQLDQEDDDLAVGHHEQLRQLDDEVPSEEASVCSTASINGATRDVLTRAQAHHQPLDFDSQQRLNEIGLPEPTSHSVAPSPSTKRASASHLGLSAGLSSVANRYGTTGRNATGPNSQPLGGSTLVTGRAMSQQSLTRPTMPLSRRLRRSGGGGGGASAGSGSDVGGSSMSLATPSSKQNGELSRSASNTRLGRPLGKTSGSRVSSQDRASHRRSVSRNNSDSESSSSMLRTLVKPRVNRMGSTNRSTRRGGRPVYSGGARDDSDLEENMDGVGQLATEIDSYKFRRRYSVPKDAKINWFSKLKQRVTSKN